MDWFDWFLLVFVPYGLIALGFVALKDTRLGYWFKGLSRGRRILMYPLVLVATLLVGGVIYAAVILVTSLGCFGSGPAC